RAFEDRDPAQRGAAADSVGAGWGGGRSLGVCRGPVGVGPQNHPPLVMIIMEALRTVLSYPEGRGTSLPPFLFLAAVSATRHIPAIGAQMSVTRETLGADQFRRAMIDLGVNAEAILAIAPALFVLGRRGAEHVVGASAPLGRRLMVEAQGEAEGVRLA